MENILLILFILIIVFNIRSIIKGIYYRRKIKKLENELYQTKKENTKLKSIFSMTSYQIRNFKEGKNPYTIMAKIIDLYRDKL